MTLDFPTLIEYINSSIQQLEQDKQVVVASCDEMLKTMESNKATDNLRWSVAAINWEFKNLQQFLKELQITLKDANASQTIQNTVR